MNGGLVACIAVGGSAFLFWLIGLNDLRLGITKRSTAIKAEIATTIIWVGCAIGAFIIY